MQIQSFPRIEPPNPDSHDPSDGFSTPPPQTGNWESRVRFADEAANPNSILFGAVSPLSPPPIREKNSTFDDIPHNPLHELRAQALTPLFKEYERGVSTVGKILSFVAVKNYVATHSKLATRTYQAWPVAAKQLFLLFANLYYDTLSKDTFAYRANFHRENLINDATVFAISVTSILDTTPEL